MLIQLGYREILYMLSHFLNLPLLLVKWIYSNYIWIHFLVFSFNTPFSRWYNFHVIRVYVCNSYYYIYVCHSYIMHINIYLLFICIKFYLLNDQNIRTLLFDYLYLFKNSLIFHILPKFQYNILPSFYWILHHYRLFEMN